MKNLNRNAMSVPKERLVDELLERIDKKNQILEKRNIEYGAERVRIYSYPENISLPGLFGFDMNDYLANPELALDIELRAKIFWLDNSHGDDNASLDVSVGTMYYDMTLFGIKIKYQSDGVPIYQPHELMEKADMSLLKPFDFFTAGEMPAIHKRYEAFKDISRSIYGDRLKINFPYFGRGPLDIYIQLRGYDNFVDDISDNPQFVHELLAYIVEERYRYNKETAAFKNENLPNMGIADDWVNIPFVSPAIFEKFIIPAYLKIQENEGPVCYFHTCGAFEPLVPMLLKTFPAFTGLEISGWNDWDLLDNIVNPAISFWLGMINTFVLFATEEEQRKKIEQVARISKHRLVNICAQAIVKAHDTFDESIYRMNKFIDLARENLKK